jgi:hypothetical protein
MFGCFRGTAYFQIRSNLTNPTRAQHTAKNVQYLLHSTFPKRSGKCNLRLNLSDAPVTTRAQHIAKTIWEAYLRLNLSDVPVTTAQCSHVLLSSRFPCFQPFPHTMPRSSAHQEALSLLRAALSSISIAQALELWNAIVAQIEPDLMLSDFNSESSSSFHSSSPTPPSTPSTIPSYSMSDSGQSNILFFQSEEVIQF